LDVDSHESLRQRTGHNRSYYGITGTDSLIR
jgi:hypothetical protein